MTTLALAGDAMLGRGVAAHLADHPVRSLFGTELLELLADTDGMLLNLECCISERGIPRPGRVFHFRAPPAAVDALTLLGVRAVTLANNHTLDYGEIALRDTLDHLHRAGIATAGAGDSVRTARAPAAIELGGTRVSVLSVTDHPVEYAAGPDRPGVAYVDLHHQLPGWLTLMVREAVTARTPLLVSPHWGPNMTARPEPYVRRAATDLRTAGVWLVAGHSAHVFHGVTDRTLFDLGDFVDDYATDPVLRNDLGLVWLLSIDDGVPTTLEAVPLHVDYCHTSLAYGADARWVCDRLQRACTDLGTQVCTTDGRLRVRL